jgi:WD40 repeat protein
MERECEGAFAFWKTLEGHKDSVNSVIFLADRKTLISGSADKTIRIWDLITGNNMKMLEGYEYGVRMVAISRDEKTLASVSFENEIKIWDIST